MAEQEAGGAALVLDDGAVFPGVRAGKACAGAGEVVFTTGMTGYPQALTDPSFRGQILVFTYPLLGNYGVPLQSDGAPFRDERGIPLHFESDRVQVAGLIASGLCSAPSHYDSGATLPEWLEKNGVPAMFGVDTRALTKRLREKGTLRGKILPGGMARDAQSGGEGFINHPVPDVSCAEIIRYGRADGGARAVIALVDCGVKANILRCLLGRGVDVIRVPWDYDVSSVECDGIFLSNGPGDPKSCGKTIAMLRKALSRRKPVFGVCLGAQIMALAAGGDTYKLPYGHRSLNQPCLEKESGRCYITSQNHGYAVRGETLPKDWEVWFTNANDGTVEGIRSKNAPFWAVQFHPEGCPGPRDTEFLLDRFLEAVTRQSRRA